MTSEELFEGFPEFALGELERASRPDVALLEVVALAHPDVDRPGDRQVEEELVGGGADARPGALDLPDLDRRAVVIVCHHDP